MKNIRVVDVETSGLDPKVDRVVEVAVADLFVSSDKGKFERGETWSSLVNPGIPIPPEASAVHDIVDEMVKDAPTMQGLLPRIKSGPDYYCAHNSRYDSQFIDTDKVWLDTYRIALWLWPQAPNHKNSTLRYWLKIPSVDLAPIGRAHGAAFDVSVTTQILICIIQAGVTIQQMVEVSTRPAILPRLGFGMHAMKLVTDVPSSYLSWVLDNITDNEDVRHTAFTELQRRRNVHPRAT